MIPISVVRTGPEEEELVLEVLRSGQLAQGEYVERLEAAFARLHGVEHAVAVNNGTTALVVALEALGVQPGDEVITSPFTFVATLNAILEAGATARFVDIGEDYNIDGGLLHAVVSERTKVLMPVHLYGTMADMEPIMDLAEARSLRVVEDAAQAVGARYRDRAAGSFGVGCFSLYATKNVTTGEGGLVTTDDAALADRLRLLRNQGMRARYQYEVAGHNYRLTNLAAAVGLPQLERLDWLNAKRRENAHRLTQDLGGIEGLIPPPAPPADRTHVYHQYTVRIMPHARLTRDQFVEAMQARGVGCGVYYPKVVYDYDCYRGHPRVVQDPVPRAFEIATQVASLPVHPYLTDRDLGSIAEAAREVLEG